MAKVGASRENWFCPQSKACWYSFKARSSGAINDTYVIPLCHFCWSRSCLAAQVEQMKQQECFCFPKYSVQFSRFASAAWNHWHKWLNAWSHLYLHFFHAVASFWHNYKQGLFIWMTQCTLRSCALFQSPSLWPHWDLSCYYMQFAFLQKTRQPVVNYDF